LLQARDFFLGDVKQLELKGSGYGAANGIDSSVSVKTNQKINNILLSLPQGMRLVVANAVYLNANWADPFNPGYTRNVPFTVRSSETMNITAMFQHAFVGYVEDAELGCQMIAMPTWQALLGKWGQNNYLPTNSNFLLATTRGSS
jgi:serpin B